MVLKRSWLFKSVFICIILMQFAVGYAQEAGHGVVLTISGNLNKSFRDGRATFTMAQLEKLPQVTFTTKTPWHAEAVTMTGPLLRDVLKDVGAGGSKLVAVALNDYKTEIPMDDALKYDVIIARLMNGKPMPIRAKGPLFLIYPFDAHSELQTQKYYFRSAWQLSQINVN